MNEPNTHEKIAANNEAIYLLDPIPGGATFIQLYEGVKIATDEWTNEFRLGDEVNGMTVRTIYFNKAKNTVNFETHSLHDGNKTMSKDMFLELVLEGAIA